MEFPLLSPDDIEIRVAQVKGSGAQLLLYKTARTDMHYLDKVVGAENWQDSYTMLSNGMILCTLSIYVDGRWVSKSDTGEAAAITVGGENAGKSTISDALKRAGTKWGIGRELYSSPFIWARVATEQKGNKWFLKDRFAKYYVREIGYDDKRRINRLVITDQYSNLVYSTDQAKYPFAVVQSVPDAAQKMPDEVRQILTEAGEMGADQPAAQTPEMPVQPTIYCTDCHSLLVPTKGKGDKMLMPTDLAELARKKFGAVYCPACMRKRTVQVA